MSKVLRSPELTCADLFAGAGGLAVGFHLAGFKPLFFNELDQRAGETFRQNFPSAVPFLCPIEELTAQQIRNNLGPGVDELDVMVGGPPCQGFSINAPVRSTTDSRNHLFRHYVRLVLEGLRPKVVVLENVPGVVSFDGGNTLKAIQCAFEGAGYRIAFGILNAAHYGVPEERWRLIFIGTRLPSVLPSLPLPTHYSLQRANFSGGREHIFAHAVGEPLQRELFARSLKAPTTVRDAIGDLPQIPSGGGAPTMSYATPAQTNYQRMMRRGSRRVLNHECSGMSEINQQRFQFVKPGGSWRDIPHELLPEGMKRARRSDHTKRYGRLNPDAPSGTIMTKCDPHWGTVVHYSQDRIISVREAARIQSFPDWFRFAGTRADQYRQVGNAVPPLLAKSIAEHVALLLHQSGALSTVHESLVKERRYAASGW